MTTNPNAEQDAAPETIGAARAVVLWLGPDQEMSSALASAGFFVRWRPRLRSASAVPKRFPIDIVIAEAGLTPCDPYRLLRSLRKRRGARHTALLVLAAQDSDVPAALKAGADDCMIRPSSIDLLAARVEAAVAFARQFVRPQPWSRHVLRGRDGIVLLDLKSFRCQVLAGVDYKNVRLTRKQFQVLAVLLKRANRIVRWQDFVARGWKPHRLRDQSRTLVQHVMRLRQALGPVGECLETLPGLGYRWND